jgi:hypothetical protein
MDNALDDDLSVGKEVFIPVQDAFEYLIDKNVVYYVDTFTYYKGFATVYENKREGPLGYYVYLDAMVMLDEVSLEWLYEDGSPVVRWMYVYKGTINGIEALPLENMIYLAHNQFDLDYKNIYVKKSDLDNASKKYGIPKNTNWNGGVSVKNADEEKTNFDDSNAVTTTSDTLQDSIIEFTKSVLIQYPNATTADLRRNCFEDMGDLNSRHCLKINDLLVKAGAKKSKKGEHAKDIAWEDKYPKAQWMRVFNKIK